MTNKLEIIVEVDSNDIKLGEITLEELNSIMPLIEAIKNFKSYEVDGLILHHNYPYGDCLREDLREKPVQELYSHIRPEIIKIFEKHLPTHLEHGFHTIVSIEVRPITKKTKLF